MRCGRKTQVSFLTLVGYSRGIGNRAIPEDGLSGRAMTAQLSSYGLDVWGPITRCDWSRL